MSPAVSPAAPHPLASLGPEVAALPFVSLGHFATRLHRVADLPPDHASGPGKSLSRELDLWVKRDDESGVPYGGNKVRKLEFLLGEARAAGATGLVTMGGFGSHHVLATAIYGRALGLGVHAVVFPQPITPHVLETIRAGAAAGCVYHAVGGFAGVVPAVARLRAARSTTWIAAGGSSPVGSLGYVASALELAAQIARGEMPPPDVIYVALGSCGTVAGLLVGLAIAGLGARVVAVRVVPAIVCNRRATLRLTAQTARLLAKCGARMPPIREVMKAAAARLVVDGSRYGGAYGLPTTEATGAVEQAGRIGLHLETTYTGKAFAALLGDAAARHLDGQRVLFWNTFSSADLAPLLVGAPSSSSDLASTSAPKPASTSASTWASLPPRLAALFASRDAAAR